MSVEFVCPNQNCGKRLSVADEKAGKNVRCPQCKEVIRAPLQSGDMAKTLSSHESKSDQETVTHRLEPVLTARGDGMAAAVEAGTDIAQGGMGKVVACHDKGLDRQMAMKVMKSGIAQSEEHRLRFLEEAQVTGQLEHPNIVPIHELGKDPDGNLYFTMKLVKGSSLGQLLREMADGSGLIVDQEHAGSGSSMNRQPLTINHLLGVFLKACDAIAFAHSRGVIHRDLKPDNIMVGDFGEVLVMDWGLAKVLDTENSIQGSDQTADSVEGQSTKAETEAETLLDGGQTSMNQHPASGIQHPGSSVQNAASVTSIRTQADAALTMEGAIHGTPSYMPPEQAEGKVDEIDHRADSYSLGAILYEILTLKRPFTGKTAHEILLKVVEGNVQPPEKLATDRDIPKELSAIAMKAMSGNRRRRYQSVSALQGDIHLYLEGRSVSAREDSLAETLIKFVRRNKAVSAATGIAVLVICVLSFLFIVQLKSERDDLRASEAKAVDALKRAEEAEATRKRDALSSSRVLAEQSVQSASAGFFKGAKLRAELAKKAAPFGPWGDYALGYLEWEKRQLGVSEKLLVSALRIDKTHKPSQATLARVRAALGRHEEAKSALKDIEALDDWRSLNSIGEALYELKDYDRSFRAYEKAMSLIKNDAGVSENERRNTKYNYYRSRAWVLSKGLAEEIRGLKPEQAYEQVRRKIREVDPENAQKFQFDAQYHQNEWVGVNMSWRPYRFLQPLQGVPLKRITAANTSIRDITPLRGMPLEYLELHSSPVSDIRPLSGMPLKTLKLGFCRGLKDLSPLSSTELRELDIHMTGVTDLGPLKGLPIEKLNIANTAIRDLSALKGSPLKLLVLASTKISNLEPLRGVPLESLHGWGGNAISDLGPLADAPLKSLVLREGPIRDISPVKKMPLQYLDLGLCHSLRDLTPLRGKKIKNLTVHGKKQVTPESLEVINEMEKQGTKVTWTD